MDITSVFTKEVVVEKRNGEHIAFDAMKIKAAIEKAFKACKEYKTSEKEIVVLVLNMVLRRLQSYVSESKETPAVLGIELIQDTVEASLYTNAPRQVTKAFMLYRSMRSNDRALTSVLGDLGKIEDYLGENDWRAKENSNTTFSLQGLNNYISSSVTAVYWLNKIYTEPIKNAHVNGDIHIHDLGLLASYCVGWDLLNLLTNGFRGVEGKITCSPPKHFKSALGQCVNFLYSLQGEAAGAQAFSSFDTYLAPFIRHDGLSYKEVKQALQEFVYNLNVPTRVGFQTPFTNITMDLQPNPAMKNDAVIIGGVPQETTYGDYAEEMAMLNKAFLEVMSEGDAAGKVFTFPIPTYNITKDFDWEAPIVEEIMAITGKYGTPTFANFVNSDMEPEDVRSMCCRLRLDNKELQRRGGGLFGANPKTGSLGVVTINMPRIGYLTKKNTGTEKEFFERLEYLMELARTSLSLKRNAIERYTRNNLYPYTKYYLREVYERFGQYWKNHFNTIGLVGMNEAIRNLNGGTILDEEGKKFAMKVMDFMNSKLREYQEEDDMMYNLEATPAEGTAYRLAKKDKEAYPDIITAGTDEAPFYTNSTHVPIDEPLDLFTTLTHQDDLQTKYTGGTTLHIFLGEAVNDAKAIAKLVRKVAENFKLPYFTVTPTFSICPVHGYLSGKHYECPKCKLEHQVMLQKEIAGLRQIAEDSE